MARNQVVVTCTGGSWTQLTNADATNITFQVMPGSPPVYIRVTTDTTTPTETVGLVYHETEGELDKAIADMFGLASADRVWAKPLSNSRDAKVFVDHA